MLSKSLRIKIAGALRDESDFIRSREAKIYPNRVGAFSLIPAATGNLWAGDVSGDSSMLKSLVASLIGILGGIKAADLSKNIAFYGTPGEIAFLGSTMAGATGSSYLTRRLLDRFRKVHDKK
jgi:hypothetical protein